MPLDPLRNPYRNNAPQRDGVATSWVALTNAMINTDLARYAKYMRIRMSSSATVPLVLAVVELDEPNDATTETLTFDASEWFWGGVRRINSVNGGATVPAGVEIQLFLD